MHHTLLPIQLQTRLRLAADTAQLNTVIQTIQDENPRFFHSEKTLKDRVFFDQPRGAHSGDFIRPAPTRHTLSIDSLEAK